MRYLKISNIKLGLDENSDERILSRACSIAGISSKDIISKKIIRHSVDARDKNDIKHVYSVLISVKKYTKKRKNVVVCSGENKYSFKSTGSFPLYNRPVVVGFGPAGMFSSYLLALNGYKPLVFERGSDVDKRTGDVEKIINEDLVNPNSNVCFGEGGAGTFSDGKLNTGISDKNMRIKFVLETLVHFGAPENILYESKPHIGTDILKDVVKNIRLEIQRLGGTFYFDAKVDEIVTDGKKISAVKLGSGEIIQTDVCVIAIGNAARDTFKMLYKKGLHMESKPFAVGVRAEHRQADINHAMYGFKDNRLGASSYKLTYTTKDGRFNVYSFCMCPGGYVINSSTDSGGVSVNGMSYSKREGENANSAIVVGVDSSIYGNGVFSGMEFQEDLEMKAKFAGRGKIPVQLLADFVKGRASTETGRITPNIKGEYAFADINTILPAELCSAIKEAFLYFGKKIEGFDCGDVVLSAVESRTSSPVRIVRGSTMEANIKGIYPAGEGAGYAGGITSSAVDGIKIFESIAGRYLPPL